MQLIFMGTPEFAVPSLNALHQAGHSIVAVYCQPPREKGRGQQLQTSPVQQAAELLNLPVYTPKTLRCPEVQQHFASHGATVAVVAAYGLILPQAILDIPRYGCLNIHASLLPRWRGASPIQRAILAGDSVTGITLMQMEAGLDSGPILAKSAEVPISGSTTAVDLQNRLALLGAELSVEILKTLEKGELNPIVQPTLGICHAPKLTKEEGLLDFSHSANQLDRQIRAFSPWPGTWFDHEGDRIKVLKAMPLVEDSFLPFGSFYSTAEFPLLVKCGEGGLALQTLQRPGSRALESADFLRGYSKLTIPLVS